MVDLLESCGGNVANDTGPIIMEIDRLDAGKDLMTADVVMIKNAHTIVVRSIWQSGSSSTLTPGGTGS